jgi:hypothetical protein
VVLFHTLLGFYFVVWGQSRHVALRTVVSSVVFESLCDLQCFPAALNFVKSAPPKSEWCPQSKAKENMLNWSERVKIWDPLEESVWGRSWAELWGKRGESTAQGVRSASSTAASQNQVLWGPQCPDRIQHAWTQKHCCIKGSRGWACSSVVEHLP